MSKSFDTSTPYGRFAMGLLMQVAQLERDLRRVLGALPDQREAAARLDTVFSQLTHWLGLLYQAPEIQEQIMMGELKVGEAALRDMARIVGWDAQRTALLR